MIKFEVIKNMKKGRMVIKPINVFISYRRKDSKANARSLYQALKDDFEVFFDIDKENSISYGQNFPERIEKGIKDTDVFIPIIGKEFALELDNRKDKHDWVLEEILAAKKLEKKFLPLFIDGAGMPNDGELAENVDFVRAIDTFNLSHDKFEQDIETVKRAIRKLVFVPTIESFTSKSSASLLFERLEKYLKALEWEKANNETIDLLLKISKRKKEKWLREEDIESISCDVFFTINRLWEKYSNACFSFSVQQKLLDEEGLSFEQQRDFKMFSELVHWNINSKWCFEGNEEMRGSYPTPICYKKESPVNRRTFQYIMKKIKKCEEQML